LEQDEVMEDMHWVSVMALLKDKKMTMMMLVKQNKSLNNQAWNMKERKYMH